MSASGGTIESYTMRLPPFGEVLRTAAGSFAVSAGITTLWARSPLVGAVAGGVAALASLVDALTRPIWDRMERSLGELAKVTRVAFFGGAALVALSATESSLGLSVVGSLVWPAAAILTWQEQQQQSLARGYVLV